MPSSSVKKAVLVCHGSFNPAHRHHIEMMIRARECLEQSGFQVVRGVFAITSRDYLQNKGVEAVTDSHRLKVLDLAFQDAPGPPGWLRADGRGVHYRSVGQMIQGVWGPEFAKEAPGATIFKVIGADTVLRVRSKGIVTKGPAVIFQRAGTELPLHYVSGKNIFFIDELPGELSSTRLRKAIQSQDIEQISEMCSRPVADYLVSNASSLYEHDSRAARAEEPSVSYKGQSKGRGKHKSAPQGISVTEKHDVVLIGIAGPSGCGKTTLATRLAEILGSPVSPILCDWYNGVGIKEKKDYEKPESHDFKALAHDLKCVRDVLAHAQHYPKEINVGKTGCQARNIMVKHWSPMDLRSPYIPVVVEGFLLFHEKTICDIFDLHVWLEAELEECASRRFNRKSKNREADLDSFRMWYRDVVWSHFLKYKDTQLFNANDALRLNGNGSVDALAEQVIQSCADLVPKAPTQPSAGPAGHCEGASAVPHERLDAFGLGGAKKQSKQRRWPQQSGSN